MRHGRGGLVWLFLAGYGALLGWVLFGTDKRFLRRIGVDIYQALGDAMPGAVRPVHYELLIYALLFIPLGWLAQRATNRAVAWVVMGCAWVVVMIEFAQIFFLDREASAVEVIVASLGASLGAVIANPKDIG